MDDTQAAIVKTAFAFAGMSAGIAKMLGALHKVNAGQQAEAAEAIADAVAALQRVEPQIREMLEAVQRIAVA